MTFLRHDREAIYLQGYASLGSVLGLFVHTLKFQTKYKLLVKSLSSYNILHFLEMIFVMANCIVVSV